MTTLSFMNQLTLATKRNHSLLCVGLDPDLNKLPALFANEAQPFFAFNRAIIDATHDLVCAYKPQIAYYHARRAEIELELTIAYIQKNYPHVPVILDAKRGDIGNTAAQYALEAFDRYAADAVTVNPYLGHDSLQPFLDYADKGVIILCHTSNPGAKDLQELRIGNECVYEKLASLAATQWNQHGNVALVVGGTYPEALGHIRARVGNMPLLVPGIGAQGASIEQVVTQGKTLAGDGLIISASRSILYASSGADFAKAARTATLELRDEINRYR